VAVREDSNSDPYATVEPLAYLSKWKIYTCTTILSALETVLIYIQFKYVLMGSIVVTFLLVGMFVWWGYILCRLLYLMAWEKTGRPVIWIDGDELCWVGAFQPRMKLADVTEVTGWGWAISGLVSNTSLTPHIRIIGKGWQWRAVRFTPMVGHVEAIAHSIWAAVEAHQAAAPERK